MNYKHDFFLRKIKYNSCNFFTLYSFIVQSNYFIPEKYFMLVIKIDVAIFLKKTFLFVTLDRKITQIKIKKNFF